jgi:hypothetical protein
VRVSGEVHTNRVRDCHLIAPPLRHWRIAEASCTGSACSLLVYAVLDHPFLLAELKSHWRAHAPRHRLLRWPRRSNVGILFESLAVDQLRYSTWSLLTPLIGVQATRQGLLGR